MRTTQPRPIFFTTESTGRKVAYRWEGRQLRSFRMPLAQAEIEIATGVAVDIGGHPMKAPTSSPEAFADAVDLIADIQFANPRR